MKNLVVVLSVVTLLVGVLFSGCSDGGSSETGTDVTDVAVDTAGPGADAVDSAQPADQSAPDTAAPDVPGDDTLVPDVPGEDTTVPDVPGQDTTVPDVPGQDTAVPDVPGEDTTVPDVPGQDTTVPDVPGQDTAVPDVPGQDTTVPDVPGQDTTVPDVPGEDTAVPDVPGQDTTTPPGGPIIADHTIVDRYDDIPPEYLDQVKTMWVNIVGESHSAGYRNGIALLAATEPTYAAIVTEDGDPAPYGTDALRISRHRRTQYNSWAMGTGESTWYTNEDGKALLEDHITYCETNDLHITAIGFGWCWDMTWHNSPGGDIDPVYQVRWAGSSDGGPDGDMRWGLDDEDFALTGNQISMDTYLAATQEFIAHCTANGFTTTVLFTTGPVDGYSGESGYQRQLKHDHIRQFVAADPTRVLFDYADILAWSDAGEENLQVWADDLGGDHDYQMIHADNMLDLDGSYAEDGDHIGERGAVRLGKATWWLLARLAGWDGS